MSTDTGTKAELSKLSTESYRAARVVAPKVQAYFARQVAAARARGVVAPAPVPDASVLERVIDATFWASLRREEGYVPKISLAYVPPEQSIHPLLFEHPLPLTPSALTKVAPVVERPGIHLGLWHNGDALCVWGTTHAIPVLSFVLEVVEPGLLVVKHHRGERAGKYVNVAVLEGDQIKMVDESASGLPDCPSLLKSLLGFDLPAVWAGSINLVVELAVSMRAHGRGGALLIVPARTEQWRESIVRPIAYAVAPPYRGLAQLTRLIREGTQADGWQEELREAIDAIAGLTAVDGATVMTDDYELLAFGAKIMRRNGWAMAEHVRVTEPIEGAVPIELAPTELGGTRHGSAVQFVHDQRDAVALVASQDRRFTVLAWSPHDERVRAHRVEALLL
jgi:hypothetical protein